MTRRFIGPLLAVIFCLAAGSLGCEKQPATLSEREKALAVRTGLEEFVLLEAKRFGKKPAQLKGIDQEFRETERPGITVEVSRKKAVEAVKTLRAAIGPNGYLAYYAEQHFGIEPDKIAVIRSDDPFEMLRVRHTNGINYEIENEAVIAKLKEWDERFGLNLIGADFDWVEAEFRTRPDDMAAFAKEVYEFCPDVVDQGVGTVEALADEMRRTNTLYLWWD